MPEKLEMAEMAYSKHWPFSFSFPQVRLLTSSKLRDYESGCIDFSKLGIHLHPAYLWIFQWAFTPGCCVFSVWVCAKENNNSLFWKHPRMLIPMKARWRYKDQGFGYHDSYCYKNCKMLTSTTPIEINILAFSWTYYQMSSLL